MCIYLIETNHKSAVMGQEKTVWKQSETEEMQALMCEEVLRDWLRTLEQDSDGEHDSQRRDDRGGLGRYHTLR